MPTVVNYMALEDGTPTSAGIATKTLETSRGLDFELDAFVTGVVRASVPAGLLHDLTTSDRLFILRVSDVDELPMLVAAPPTQIYRVQAGQPLTPLAVDLSNMFFDPERDAFTLAATANTGAPLTLSYNANTMSLSITPTARTSSISTITVTCTQGGVQRASGSFQFDQIGEATGLRAKRLTETPALLTARRGTLESVSPTDYRLRGTGENVNSTLDLSTSKFFPSQEFWFAATEFFEAVSGTITITGTSPDKGRGTGSQDTVEFAHTTAAQTINGVSVPAGSLHVIVYRSRFTAEDAANGFTLSTTLTATDQATTATKQVSFFFQAFASEAAVRIDRNPAFADTALDLAANAEQTVNVSNAFFVYPTGTPWVLTASSADMTIATVTVQNVPKTLGIAGAINLDANDSTTITYTATAGSVSTSRTRTVNVAAPADDTLTADTLTATPSFTISPSSLRAGTDYSVSGIGQTAAAPLNIGANTNTFFEVEIPATELFTTTLARGEIALLGPTFSPLSVAGQDSRSAVFFSGGFTGNAFSMEVELPNWTQSQKDDGFTVAVTFEATDGANDLSRTLYLAFAELDV